MRTGPEKEEDKRGKHRPRWDRRVIRPLGDEESVDPKERVAAECQIPCANGRTHCNESEWSTMISLIRRLGFPYAPSASRYFNEMRGSHAFCLDHVLL